MDIEWKTSHRVGYTNYVAIVDEQRVVVLRPTPGADYIVAVDDVDQEGTYPTAAAARKAAQEGMAKTADARTAKWNAGVFMDRSWNIEGPVSGDELARETSMFPRAEAIRRNIRLMLWLRASIHTSEGMNR